MKLVILCALTIIQFGIDGMLIYILRQHNDGIFHLISANRLQNNAVKGLRGEWNEAAKNMIRRIESNNARTQLNLEHFLKQSMEETKSHAEQIIQQSMENHQVKDHADL